MRLICYLFGHARAISAEFRPDGPGSYRVAWQTCPRCGADHKAHERGGLLARTLECGYELPRGYGVAWPLWHRDAAVVMPIPLNLAVGYLYRAWCWMKAPRWLARDPHVAYQDGLREGYRQGADGPR